MKNQIITPEMKKSLEDKFLGKRVMVKTKHGKIGGICNFIGNNEYVPSFGLQITVDRMPITNVEIKDISLI
jgi:hypothetical protein